MHSLKRSQSWCVIARRLLRSGRRSEIRTPLLSEAMESSVSFDVHQQRPNLSGLQPVACPFTASFAPFSTSSPGSEWNRQEDSEEEDDHKMKSKVRKMGVFLARAAAGGVAAAAVSAWSYGEIRKRSRMENQNATAYLNPDFEEEVDFKSGGFPALLAEQPIDESSFHVTPKVKSTGKGSRRRERFNFIAEVVEETAASLVYIEIKDLGVTDYVTGQPTTSSNGSGFIVKEDGLILTNAHVVINKPRASVQVRLQDGRTFTGFLEDIDVKSDLATVRIPCKNLPVMRLGRSSEVKPGEFVIAMGSPLSLSNTITTGVVSSVARNKRELGLRGRDVPDYLQTDAAITFGNSGGPLINLDGEAIGINSMKITPGISFAIPIDYAKEFLQKSEDSRKGFRQKESSRTDGVCRQRRYMGTTMFSLNNQVFGEIKGLLEIPSQVSHGVLLFRIVHGSPADRAGILPGDIVTHINGEAIYAAEDVFEFLEGDQNLILTVVRKNQIIKFKVVPES